MHEGGGRTCDVVFLEALEGRDKVDCPCGLQRVIMRCQRGRADGAYVDDHRDLVLQLPIHGRAQAQVGLAERRGVCHHAGTARGELSGAQTLIDTGAGVCGVFCAAETDYFCGSWPLAQLVEEVGAECAGRAGEDLPVSMGAEGERTRLTTTWPLAAPATGPFCGPPG